MQFFNVFQRQYKVHVQGSFDVFMIKLIMYDQPWKNYYFSFYKSCFDTQSCVKKNEQLK